MWPQRINDQTCAGPMRRGKQAARCLAWAAVMGLGLRAAAAPQGEGAALAEANLARAAIIEERFRSIPLSDQVGPWAVCHAFLALGPDYELTDTASGQPMLARDLVLGRPSYALQTMPLLTFRRSVAPRTFERHPAQFASYLILSGVRLNPTREADAASAKTLRQLWGGERFEVHDLRDMGWFIPAYCAVGDFEPFYSKFGELVGPEELVAALVAQSSDPLEPPPCGGMHLAHALFEAERTLANRVQHEVAQKLHDEARRWRKAFDQAVSADGELDPAAFADADKATTERRQVIAGHMIELASLGYEPPILVDLKLHRLIDRVLAESLSMDYWKEPASLLTRSGEFDYGAAAHLVRGLRMYRERASKRAKNELAD